jgi:hypothetical protein
MHSSFERAGLILTIIIIISRGATYAWQYDIRHWSFLNPVSTLNFYQLSNLYFKASKFEMYLT